MTKSISGVRTAGPSLLDLVFAGGSTAGFLAIMANVVLAVGLYLR